MRGRRKALWVLGGAIMASLSSGAEATPTSEWEAVTPLEAGLDPGLGDGLDAAVGDGRLEGLHGALVIRGGRLAVERYYEGADQRWGQDLGVVQHGPDLKHDLRSVSKSIVGLLYGIALDEGLVPSVDAPLLDQFPQYADLTDAEAKRAITIEHALTMSTALDWDETLPYSDPRNSEIAMERAPDRYRYVLDRPLAHRPGERWVYCGGATALLAKIIADGTGEPLLAYAREKLFAPLGVDDVEWVEGSDGEPAAASGLRMRPRDLARIGQLILNRGQWRGARIVSENWLDVALSARIDTGEGLSYGYQWWLPMPESGYRWVAGFGNGGQRLWVSPGLDMVVVVTAGRYNRPDGWKLPVSVITEHVLPAVTR